MSWKDDQKFEKDWHNNCVNSYWEETKQMHYARYMGLVAYQTPDEKYPTYDLKGKSVLDIGGGAYSLLLKCVNLGKNSMVVDPLRYPSWTYARYDAAGIGYATIKGEDIELKGFDEVWIYNCLQHTEDPEKIIQNARKAAKVIRIFEWIDRGVMLGHPQDLKKAKLDKWLGGKGKAEIFMIGNLNYGLCYSAVLNKF